MNRPARADRFSSYCCCPFSRTCGGGRPGLLSLLSHHPSGSLTAVKPCPAFFAGKGVSSHPRPAHRRALTSPGKFLDLAPGVLSLLSFIWTFVPDKLDFHSFPWTALTGDCQNLPGVEMPRTSGLLALLRRSPCLPAKGKTDHGTCSGTPA